MKQLLSIHDVRQGTGRSRSAIYADVARGIFPAPIKIGSRSLWIRSEVDAFLNERIAERDAIKQSETSARQPLRAAATKVAGGRHA